MVQVFLLMTLKKKLCHFQNLYLNHKREFIEILSKINTFNDSISKLDHFIFIPQPKDDIDSFNAIALILKNYVDEKCLPKPLYISIGNYNFKKYERPKIFD